jgi:hypothetical protein
LRFAEPVRGLSAPGEALAKLVASGEVALVEDEALSEASAAGDDDGGDEIDDDDDPDAEPEA